MKSLTLYQQQYAKLKKDQQCLMDDMVQVLHEARIDGHKIFEVMDPPKPSAAAPEFDL
jgi:hypothetical protein